MTRTNAFITVLVLLATAACGAEPSRVQVRFEWPDGRPADLGRDASIVLRVEVRSVPFEPGGVLFATEPLPFGVDDSWFRLPGIPVGSRRTVVVELRRGRDASLPIAFYGISAPFDVPVEGGVEVPVPLRPLGATPGAGSRCSGVRALGPPEGIVGPGPVSLGLSSELAVEVLVSNEGRLLEGTAATRRFRLEALPSWTGDEDCRGWRLDDWDLDAGVPPCVERDDGVCSRFVFARFIDEYGYSGTPSLAEVRVDSRGPQLIEGSVRVALRGGASSARDDVEALSIEGRMKLSFALDEPVADAPVVQAVGPGLRTVELELEAAEPTGFTYAYRVPATVTPRPGEHVVRVEARDVYGNVQVIEGVASFTIDVGAPEPPDVRTPGVIRFHRIPWGAEVSFGEPDWRLVGEDGAVESNALVVAVDSRGIEVGRQRATAEGAFGAVEPFRVIVDDPTTVEVVAIDRAGNRSDAVQVKDVRWTGSLGRNPVSPPNPHIAQLIENARPTLWQASTGLGLRPLSDAERAAAVWTDGSTVTVRGSAFSWERVGRTRLKNVDGLTEHALAFDPVRGRLVLTAAVERGVGTARHLDAEYHDHEWLKYRLTDAVPPRDGAILVYDGARGGMLLFGGVDRTTRRPMADQWFLDGSVWQRDEPAVVPPARFDAAAAYDRAHGRVVLHGGRTMEGHLDDTWTWDGETWVRQAIPGPSARSGHSLTWDERLGAVVAFGGSSESTAATADPWSYAGARWTRLNGASSPPARSQHAAAYDPNRAQLVIHGGLDVNGQALSDLWALGVDGWTALESSGDLVPPPRARHAAAYDAIRERLVFIGGEDADGNAKAEAWALYDDGWAVDITPRVGEVWPPSRGWSQMAFHPGRRLLLLYGGVSTANVPNGDTYAWNGDIWKLLEDSPPPRFGHAMAYDPEAEEVVLFGGCALYLQGRDCQRFRTRDDTWVWDGHWQELDPASSPPGRANAALGWDESGRQLLLVGGDIGPLDRTSDVWAWDGEEWRQLALDPAPPPSYGAKLGTIFTTGATTMVSFFRNSAPAVYELMAGGWQKVVDLQYVDDVSEWADAHWLSARRSFLHSRGFAFGSGTWGFVPEVGFSGQTLREPMIEASRTEGLLYGFLGQGSTEDVLYTREDWQRLGLIVEFVMPDDIGGLDSALLVVEGSIASRGESGLTVDVWDRQRGRWRTVYGGDGVGAIEVSIPDELVNDRVRVRLTSQDVSDLVSGYRLVLERLELTVDGRLPE